MRLAVTGFVSEQAGSVASANALLLRALLERGCAVEFFSKASFVDPRPAVGDHPDFRFHDVDNIAADRTRAALSHVPVAGFAASLLDAATYNRLLVRRMNRVHRERPFDLAVWLGDYARGRTPGLPAVSFAQGPPGTDARSLLERRSEISRLAGPGVARKWALMARFRLSRPGLPRFSFSDAIIVGSSQSARTLRETYREPAEKIFTLPYPIDLDLFRPRTTADSGPLRVLWLGRVIPRKRLDLFLDGGAEAIRRGAAVRLTIVGGVGFVPGYEKLAAAFPFPDHLTWGPATRRAQIPELLAAHDVLCQPSDEENFGSSVAEAQACGLPVIVGRTNGNADYLCVRDRRLATDDPQELGRVLAELAERKQSDTLGDPATSRRCAETFFALDQVADRLMDILSTVHRGTRGALPV